METAIKILAGAIAVVSALFFIIILSTLLGGIAGWTVGLVFTDSIAVVKSFLGVTCTNFELGAGLGFVGGFFKSTLSSSSD